MDLPFDPKKFGAETASDTGAFLVGASIGGIADAVANAFGFVEPFVAAGLCGAGTLGLKKWLWDGTGRLGQTRKHDYAELDLEAFALKANGEDEAAALLRKLMEEGRRTRLPASQVRDVFQHHKPKKLANRRLIGRSQP